VHQIIRSEVSLDLYHLNYPVGKTTRMIIDGASYFPGWKMRKLKVGMRIDESGNYHGAGVLPDRR